MMKKLTYLAFITGLASVSGRAATINESDFVGQPTVEILSEQEFNAEQLQRNMQHLSFTARPLIQNDLPPITNPTIDDPVPTPLPGPKLPPVVTTTPAPVPLAPPPVPPYNASNAIDNARDAVSVARDIVNLGKDMWSLVDNNRPTIDHQAPFDSHSASAVPDGIKSFSEMANWKGPRTALLRLRWANIWNAEVATFVYRISYYYGGNFHGQGHYLKNVTVIPEYVTVVWGFNFTSSVSVVDPVNYGSETDPLAGLQLIVSYSLQSAMKKETGRCSHVVRGDGAMENLSRVCEPMPGR